MRLRLRVGPRWYSVGSIVSRSLRLRARTCRACREDAAELRQLTAALVYELKYN